MWKVKVCYKEMGVLRPNFSHEVIDGNIAIL